MGQIDLVDQKQDRAETATTKPGQLIHAQNTRLLPTDLFQLNLLKAANTHAGIDLVVHDGIGHVHANAHRLVSVVLNPRPTGQIINNDAAKVANVANAFAANILKPPDTARLQENQTGGWLMKQRAHGNHLIAFGAGSVGMNHRLQGDINPVLTNQVGDIGRVSCFHYGRR